MKWKKELSEKGLNLTRINNNLVDLIWSDDRPEIKHITIQVLHKSFAGENWQNKIVRLRRKLRNLNCDAMIVSSLTEIAYLLNIRGRDIPYTPVVKVWDII